MRSETIAVVAVAAVALLVFGFLGVMWLLVSLPGTGSGSSTELQCETTPKPICFRLVDHISDSYKRPNPDLPFDIVTVTPTACDGHERGPGDGALLERQRADRRRRQRWCVLLPARGRHARRPGGGARRRRAQVTRPNPQRNGLALTLDRFTRL